MVEAEPVHGAPVREPRRDRAGAVQRRPHRGAEFGRTGTLDIGGHHFLDAARIGEGFPVRFSQSGGIEAADKGLAEGLVGESAARIRAVAPVPFAHQRERALPVLVGAPGDARCVDPLHEQVAQRRRRGLVDVLLQGLDVVDADAAAAQQLGHAQDAVVEREEVADPTRRRGRPGCWPTPGTRARD